mmetsp:Transcript_20440/g.51162  ORF Transcript_20440/g.51162 Transcript_20440/m.51162 type:complete len:117 (+) Transcript_20440:212-562(+)
MQGDVPAARQLGDLHYDRGDYPEAMQEWSTHSTDAQCVHNVAHLYEWGLGVEQSAAEALRMYKKAASLGFSGRKRATAAEADASPYGGLASGLAGARLAVSEALREVAGAVVSHHS